jgi:hypothetical protein
MVEGGYSKPKLMTLGLLLCKDSPKPRILFDYYDVGDSRFLSKANLEIMIKNIFYITGVYLPAYAGLSVASESLKSYIDTLKTNVDGATQIAVSQLLEGRDDVTKTRFLTITRELKWMNSTASIREFIREKKLAPGTVVTRR